MSFHKHEVVSAFSVLQLKYYKLLKKQMQVCTPGTPQQMTVCGKGLMLYMLKR